MSSGDGASPSTWIAIVLIAKPRPRISGDSTLAIAALSGPVLMKNSSSVRNIAGQKIAGEG